MTQSLAAISKGPGHAHTFVLTSLEFHHTKCACPTRVSALLPVIHSHSYLYTVSPGTCGQRHLLSHVVRHVGLCIWMPGFHGVQPAQFVGPTLRKALLGLISAVAELKCLVIFLTRGSTFSFCAAPHNLGRWSCLED